LNVPKNHHAVRVTDLAIGYKKTTIAQAINFEVSPGELMAIIGVNGIGKSTLLRTLGNVQPARSGTIECNGKDLKELKATDLAAAVSMVLTETIPSKNMTVWELIALGRQPYTNWIGSLTEIDKTKIEEAIQMLELDDLQHKVCYELSDGQLQRAMIARALAQDTPIILLDEPTSHLDLYHKVQILKVLQAIAKNVNKIVVFTSHEIEMALQLCDKILLLDGDNNPVDTPEALIHKKVFDHMFPNDTMTFNAATKSFKFVK